MAERLREVGKNEAAEAERRRGSGAAPDGDVVAAAEGRPTGGGPRPEQQPARAGGRGRRGFVAALVILLIGTGFVAFVESRRATELAARVDSLSLELASARTELQAYRTHLGEIRGLVADVQRRLEELAALAAEEPEVPVGGPLAPASPAELPAAALSSEAAGEPSSPGAERSAAGPTAEEGDASRPQ